MGAPHDDDTERIYWLLRALNAARKEMVTLDAYGYYCYLGVRLVDIAVDYRIETAIPGVSHAPETASEMWKLANNVDRWFAEKQVALMLRGA